MRLALIFSLPVDVLINEDGIVERVKYAKDLSDHIPVKDLIKFSN